MEVLTPVLFSSTNWWAISPSMTPGETPKASREGFPSGTGPPDGYDDAVGTCWALGGHTEQPRPGPSAPPLHPSPKELSFSFVSVFRCHLWSHTLPHWDLRG